MKKISILIAIINAGLLTSGEAQNTWTQKSDFGGSDRSFAVGFSIANKGYIGTGLGEGTLKKDFWEFDPATNIWTQKADFGGSAREGAIGFSIFNKGYLGTGYDVNNTNKKDFWEYDPVVNSWTQKADFGGAARYYATGFTIGNKGYVGTGINSSFAQYIDFWEYDPSINTWKKKADFTGGIRYGATGFGIGNKGYLGTGVGFGSEKDFWEYDPANNTWKKKADFGGSARSYATGFNISDKGYIGIGWINAATYKDFWEYDPATNNWTQKADFGGTVRGAAISFKIGHKGYIGTGNSSYQYETNYKDFWEYSPEASIPICNIPMSLWANILNSTTVTLQWDDVAGALGYQIWYKSAETLQWEFTNSTTNEKTITGLTPNTQYAWSVRSVCSASLISENSAQLRFTTPLLRQSNITPISSDNKLMLVVHPNPVSKSGTISFLLNEASSVTIEIIDVNGRLQREIVKKDFSAGINEVTFNSEFFLVGIYFLRLKTNESVMIKKFTID